MTAGNMSSASGDSGQRTLLDTTDLDEARESVGAAYCPHRLTVLRHGRLFHAVQREANVGSVSVHSLEYGATVGVDPVPLDSWVLVSSPIRGRLRVRSGRHERNVGVGESVVLDPFRKFSLCFDDDCRLRTVRFDRNLVERVLGEISGTGSDQRVEFDLGGPRSSKAATIWRSVSALLERHALTGQAGYPLLLAELERTAVAALVETHPLRSPADITTRAGWVLPAKIRRVTEYIEAEPDRCFSTDDLATAAGLSKRALQEAFRRYLETTPLGYVRQIRLRRAHDDLTHAGADTEVTVAQVAYRWGFGNLGRFARAYAQSYGCHPSETLRR